MIRLQRKTEPPRSQVSGAEKDEFILRAVREVPELGEEVAQRIAQHLCSRVEAITSSRAIIERYRKPQFNPNAFSAMKIYRASGERGLRDRLNEIDESRQLQELAKAQQISLPRELRGKAADASALRDAIVKGVKSRHEDWQAAS